jgi:hypothetical protein
MRLDKLTASLGTLLENADTVRGPVGVLHWAKSGSYLLCSLLDGHPQVLQNPFEAMFLYPYRENELFAGRPEAVLPKDEVLRWAEANYDAIGGARGPAVQARADFMSFLALILSRRPRGIDRASLINAVHVAYAAARRRPISTIEPTLVWNVHAINPIETLKILHPGIRFVSTVRFPEKAMDSELFAFCFQSPNFDTPEIVRRNLAAVFEMDRPLAAGHVATRFEDMHCEPERTTRALASWIGLDWEPSMLESTIDGEPYYFPREYAHTKPGGDARGVTGFSPERALDRTFNILSPADRLLIRLVLKRHYAHWGYDSGLRAWPPVVEDWVFSVLALFPMRAQRRMFLRDCASASRARSAGGLFDVCCRYLAELMLTRRLLVDKRRASEALIPILTVRNTAAGKG